MVTLVVALLAAHVLRLAAGEGVDRFALTSVNLARGRYWGLLFYQFVHGGWAHLLMNSAFVLAFGVPVARYLGGTGRGGITFLAFFLFCGVVAAMAYGAMTHIIVRLGAAQPSPWALVGASGSASGLLGATARLMQGQGRPGNILAPLVVSMTGGWFLVNLVLGISGLTPGAGGAPVAWEAHISGYFCGLLAIGLFGRIGGVGLDHAIAL